MAEDVFDMDEALKFLKVNGRASAKIPKTPLTGIEKFLAALKSQEDKFRELVKTNPNPTSFPKTAWVQWAPDAKVYSVKAGSPALLLDNGAKYVKAATTDEVLYVFEIIRRMVEVKDSATRTSVISKYGTAEERKELGGKAREMRMRDPDDPKRVRLKDLDAAPKRRGRKPKASA